MNKDKNKNFAFTREKLKYLIKSFKKIII